jgi:hypothetical protein
VVDGANHHVFVDGSPDDSQIVVMNEDGTIATTISGESDASGMVIDGSTLYVARCQAHTIDEISTTTLTNTGSFSVPIYSTTSSAFVCRLGLADGRLWFEGEDNSGNATDLESVSLDSSHTVVDSGTGVTANLFAATPSHPSWLVTDSNGDGTELWDVTDPSSLTLLSQHTSQYPLADMTISPDGSVLYTARFHSQALTGFTLPGLTPTSVSYPGASGNEEVGAVAVSPAGDKLASANFNTADGAQLFHVGTPTRLTSWDTPSGNGNGVTDVAFNEDGTKLFLLYVDNILTFNVVSALVGNVTISASHTHVTYPAQVTITAHLGTASTNQTLSIYRSSPTSATPVLVASGPVDANGNLTFTQAPVHNARYTAVWTGDANYAPPQPAPGVTVSVKEVTHIRTFRRPYRVSSGGYRLYHYHSSCASRRHTACPSFQGYAKPGQARTRFHFLLEFKYRGRWRSAVSGYIRSGKYGIVNLFFSYRNRSIIGIDFRLRFSMPTNASNVGTVSPWLYWRVTN